MTNLIFNGQKSRIMDILKKHLKTSQQVYGFRMSNYEMTIQSHFCPRIIHTLNRKKFKMTINSLGYLHMSKEIGNMEILFVFTD